MAGKPSIENTTVGKSSSPNWLSATSRKTALNMRLWSGRKPANGAWRRRQRSTESRSMGQPIRATRSELVRDSTGTFRVDLILADSGRHHYRWEATGSAHGAEEASFDVRTSNVV